MTPNRTVNDALTHMRQMAQDNPDLARHRRTCLVRETGSWVDGLPADPDGVESFLRALCWEEAPHLVPATAQVPGCRYFRAFLSPEVVAFRNVVTVEEAITFNLRLEVRVHKPSTAPTPEGRAQDPNPWGLGIFAVGGNARPIRTREVWIVLGSDGNGGLIVWCWHPGVPAALVRKRHYRALSRIGDTEWVHQPSVWEILLDERDPIGEVTVHLGQRAAA